MIIRLKEIPGYERHLLFCSNLSGRRPKRRRRRRWHSRRAVNRSLRVHGETVSQLVDRIVISSGAGSLPGAA